MGKIYSGASLVRMWIGTESDSAAQAFDLIHQCGQVGEKSEELVAATVIQNEAATKALTKLLERDYWNRMWVFQEIVLAKGAVVHCGRLQAPWSTLRWLDVVSSRHVPWLSAQTEHPWIFEFRKALFRIAHFCISPGEARHINNVLHPTRNLQCQDPRDKLYALHGVCEALKGIVEVDYSVPVRDVFTAFAKNQILQERNLSPLLLVSGPHSMETTSTFPPGSLIYATWVASIFATLLGIISIPSTFLVALSLFTMCSIRSSMATFWKMTGIAF
ncbi:hypothetical protein F5883DRAFT_113116 [Diaporthe sp. PMI_573]|nr:hypothetical protein F5883DRAFT_113116 [Diaporthaceae sp. PMI_573]